MNNMALRSAMVPVSRRVRAYFAPFDHSRNRPAVFDPGKHGAFLLDAPPVPWLELGEIERFQRTSGTEVHALLAGSSRAPGGQFRRALNARVEFDFREWGKLQMALAGGSEHMNVLAPDPDAGARPSGGIPAAAVGVLDGSTESEIVLGAGTVDAFAVGDMLAIDLDYAQQTGWVGTGIAAAYVKDAADVQRDKDYVRRVTFNIGRIAVKTATAVWLAQPLPGGVPPAGAGAQRIVAFVDREGGSFFQDWSALFVQEEESGGRVCFYYPRLSPSRPAGNAGTQFQAETPLVIQAPLEFIALHASFLAMPYRDENDSEIVVCYRSYFPAEMSAVY
ncbi:MAG: hypothetical protein WA628_25910 [Terriglobales bacterium]